MVRNFTELVIWLVFAAFAAWAIGPAGILLTDLLLLLPVYCEVLFLKK